MKGKRFKPEQISRILKEFDEGKSVQELTREYGGRVQHHSINGVSAMEAWAAAS